MYLTIVFSLRVRIRARALDLPPDDGGRVSLLLSFFRAPELGVGCLFGSSDKINFSKLPLGSPTIRRRRRSRNAGGSWKVRGEYVGRG